MDSRSSSSTCFTVLRRGQPFFMAVHMKDPNFDPQRDNLRPSFSFGIYIKHRKYLNLYFY